jgi:iron(III) transport system substrate-binding protein
MSWSRGAQRRVGATIPGVRRAPRTRAGVVLPLLLVTAIASAACGSGAASGSGGSGGQTITLYNAQHEQTTSALVAAFTKATGIQVRIKSDDEDDLTAQIEEEGSRSPADVIYTENSNWLEQLGQRGLLALLPSSILQNVPAADSATNGDWVGVSARISVMVYNTNKLTRSELPTSIMQLADPKWKGKIEIAPSETDLWPVIDSVAKSYGDAAALSWLKGLKANAGANDNVPDNETLTSDVSQGITDLAIINHYYFYRLEAEVGKGSVHAAIAYFAPHDPGYVEDISGAAIVKSSPHKAAAEKFLEFITSAAGQSILAHSESFEYPIHPGIAANPELKPLSSLQPTSFTPAELGTGLEAQQLLREAGLI